MTKPPARTPLEGLVDLACRNGVDIRPTLLRVLTDLYVQKPHHTAEEKKQYAELASRLVEAVDAATRTTVAARLVSCGDAPAEIVQRLAVLAEAQAAPAPTPIDTERAAATELSDLFFAAGSQERRLILTNLDLGPAPASSDIPPPPNDLIARIERAALDHNGAEFVRHLERALGIARDHAERVVRDCSGEPIVVVAKALGMKAAVLQRILLFLNPAIGQSVQRVYDLALLYDEISRPAAERMIAIWRKAGGKDRAAAHRPVYWNDEHNPVRPASPAGRGQETVRGVAPARDRASGG